MSGPADWDIKVAWARAHGVSVATWDDQDRLSAVTLGPAPISDDDQPQHSPKPLTAAERAAAERAEHARVAMLASGRPVKLGGISD